MDGNVNVYLKTLDIPAHFGNWEKLIKIFGMVSPKQIATYLPLLNPGFKTRLMTDFTPQVIISKTENVDFFVVMRPLKVELNLVNTQ